MASGIHPIGCERRHRQPRLHLEYYLYLDYYLKTPIPELEITKNNCISIRFGVQRAVKNNAREAWDRGGLQDFQLLKEELKKKGGFFLEENIAWPMLARAAELPHLAQVSMASQLQRGVVQPSF